MEQFNYHKLINLKKRFDKYDCAISQDILAVIDKHIILEKEKSKEKAAGKTTAKQVAKNENALKGKAAANKK